MKANKPELSYSDALKLYTGEGLLMSMFKLLLMVCGAVLYIVILIHGLGMLSGMKSSAEIMESMNKKCLVDMIVSMMGATVAAAFIMNTFEKHVAGGKFFRTVKGGFKTFKKMRAAQVFCALFVITLYYLIAAVMNALTVIPLRFGLATCISGWIFVLLCFAVNNFLVSRKRTNIRIALNMLIFIVSPLGSVLVLYLTDGRLGAAQIIAAVLAAILLPMSHIIMLKQYRKNRWDN